MATRTHSHPSRHSSYLSVAQARSQASGVHFLTEGPPDPKNLEYFVPTTNGILLVMYKIMRNIMVSEAEAEYKTIFINTQTAVPIRTNLSEMGWPQGPTATQVDTPPTFQSLNPEADPVEFIFSQKDHLNPKIQKISCQLPTASYSLREKSCAISWHKQPKQSTAPP